MSQRPEHQQANSEKVEALAEVGLASAGIVHEVKNSLQGVANALVLLDTEKDLRPHARELVAIARRELARAFEVSRETLALVRDEKPVQVSPHEVLDDVLNSYAGKIAYKKIEVEKRFDFQGHIGAGVSSVRQIFANLVVNALECAPSEGGKLLVHTSAWRVGEDSAPGVRVVFVDNGPGIPENNKKRIFEPLFSTKKGKGAGLGLWVTQKLVRKLRGTLRFRSSSKNGASGTCFNLFLPLKARHSLAA